LTACLAPTFDSTASVDSLTDARLQKSLRSTAPFNQATRLIIAHRINTIIDADTVLVLEGGQLVEAGTPHELITGMSSLVRSPARSPSRSQQRSGTSSDQAVSAFAHLVDSSADAAQLRERASQAHRKQV
jgi:ABC-type multidrug transport system ATPase subunit